MFQGDSGGPLVIRSGNNFVLIGVVSFVSSAGCASGRPSGYARVTSFRAWIQNNSGVQNALEADVSVLMNMNINAVHPEQKKKCHCARHVLQTNTEKYLLQQDVEVVLFCVKISAKKILIKSTIKTGCIPNLISMIMAHVLNKSVTP